MSLKGLSPEQINSLLSKQPIKVVRYDLLYKHGFDESALFLLEIRFDNCFEPWTSEFGSSDGWWWRCKGCGRKVKRTGRESHYTWHRRELLPLKDAA